MRPRAAARISQLAKSMSAFVGPLPTHGPWTAVGLSRAQFALILGASIGVFLLLGGPVWTHLRGDHFARITVSYGLILPGVALAMRRRHPFPIGRALAASALIGLVKLVVTAALLAIIAIAVR